MTDDSGIAAAPDPLEGPLWALEQVAGSRRAPGATDDSDLAASAPPDGPLWTLEQTADFLNIPKQTLYAWRSEGKGPIGHKVGRHVRYVGEEVWAWVAEKAEPAVTATLEHDALLDADAAQQLVDQIVSSAEDLIDLILKAHAGRAWVALGFATWDELCRERLGHLRLKLPRGERQGLVVELREAGMSTRAISSATGLARNTIAADLAQAEPVEAPEIIGVNGKRYQPRTPQPVEPETEEQMREREHREAIARSVKRLRAIATYWNEITNPGPPDWQEEKLALLDAFDRETILDVFEAYHMAEMLGGKATVAILLSAPDIADLIEKGEADIGDAVVELGRRYQAFVEQASTT